MGLLVIAEHDGQSLAKSTLCVLSAAKEIGGEITLLIAGLNSGTVAQGASQIDGIQSIIHVQDALYEHALAENMAMLIQSMAKEFGHILAPATTFGKNILPRVSAVLDVQMIGDVTKIVAPDTFERPIYAGNAMATVQSLDRVKVLTIRPTAFDPVSCEGHVETTVVTTSAALGFEKTEYVSSKLSDPEKPQLTSARIVVSGGRGLKEAENFKLLETLADKLGGGAIGASRAAVDVGWVPNDYQVGQTGKVVAPELYIAVGISGAVQHLAGMKDSKIIVAINKDENAPIFEVATYGLVADLFEAVPELIEKLG
jgi:electron transfer flavoprotein alpha subunit